MAYSIPKIFAPLPLPSPGPTPGIVVPGLYDLDGNPVTSPYVYPSIYDTTSTPINFHYSVPVPAPPYGNLPEQSSIALPAVPSHGGVYYISPNPLGNRAPQPEEVTALRSTLEMKKQTAQFLEEQIAVAKDTMENLEVPYKDLKLMFESAESAYLTAQESVNSLIAQRQCLDPPMDRVRALLHPIRRYPPDILAEIFVAAVEAERGTSHVEIKIPAYRRRHIALVISQVCSSWRELAHTTPRLWTNIRLGLYRRSSVHKKFQHFVRYAKACPLNVEIHNLQPSFFPNYHDTDSDDPTESGRGGNIFNHNHVCIRSLVVNFPHYRALSHLPQLGLQGIETLEELHIRGDPIVAPVSCDFSLSSYLSHTPNLKILRLTFVYLVVDYNLHPPTILANLQHLQLTGPISGAQDLFSFPHLLALCPNLESIVYSQNETTPLVPTSPITLPFLNRINLNPEALRRSVAPSFELNRIIAPSLIELYLGSGDISSLSDSLPSFLASVPTIRRIQLWGSFDPLVQPSFFDQTTELEHLWVKRPHKRFIEALYSPNTDETCSLVLPVLKTLFLEFCNRVEIPKEDMMRLCKARYQLATADNAPAGSSAQAGLTSIHCRPLDELRVSFDQESVERSKRMNAGDGMESNGNQFFRWKRCID